MQRAWLGNRAFFNLKKLNTDLFAKNQKYAIKYKLQNKWPRVTKVNLKNKNGPIV